MKLVSGSLLVTLVSTTAWAAAPTASPAPAPVAAQSAPADAVPSPERLALARQFVGANLNEDQFFDIMQAGALDSAGRLAASSNDGKDVSPEMIEAGVSKLMTKVRPAVHAQMPRLLDAYAAAYAREFSADELQAMIAFSQTPAGRHYLARADVVESDPAIMDASMAIMEALGPALQDMAKEACAKHTAERIAAGDKKATCPLAKAAETAAG